MTLIRDIEIIRAHVNIDSSFKDIVILKPHINFAERYIKKMIGNGQYLALNAALDLDNATSEQEALLEIIHPSLSRLAVAGWVNSALSISASGVRRVESTSEKTAYKYQEDGLLKALIEEGFEMLDDIPEFLEDNELDYPLWVADTRAYTKFHQFFINTAEDFQIEYNINGSRTTFKAFYAIMKHIDFMIIRSVIGSSYYDELKTQLIERSLSTENKALIDTYIKPAVAHLVIVDAIDQLPLQITDSGVRVSELLQTFPSNVIEKTANSELTTPAKAKADSKARKYLADLKTELGTASEDKYATYYAQFGGASSTDRNSDNTNKIYRA